MSVIKIPIQMLVPSPDETRLKTENVGAHMLTKKWGSQPTTAPPRAGRREREMEEQFKKEKTQIDNANVYGVRTIRQFRAATLRGVSATWSNRR